MECALQSLSADLVARYGAGASIVFKQGPYLQALSEVSLRVHTLFHVGRDTVVGVSALTFVFQVGCGVRTADMCSTAAASCIVADPHGSHSASGMPCTGCVHTQTCLQVAAAVGAGAVFYNSRYEPAMCDSDAKVASQLSAAGLSVQASAGLLLQEPWDIKVCAEVHSKQCKHVP